MEVLKKLLENYFIVKEKDKNLYYEIKDKYKSFKPFIRDKLGYDLFIRGDFIKLEKIPGRPESWMGIDDFDNIREYIFLMLLLIFLEDKNKEEQFLLSHVTEFIAANSVGEKVDWTDYQTRRSLIKVMKFALNQNIILINDGEENEFTRDTSTEVLYESTGLSRYMVRSFSIDIMKCTSYRDLEEDYGEFLDSGRGFLRKNRVYRRLLLSPVVYNEGAEDEDYLYIKNYRNIIEGDFRKYLNWSLHVHRNGAIAVLAEGDRLKGTFPSSAGISDIVLHLNKKIFNAVKEGKLNRKINDLISMTHEAFNEFVKDLKKEMGNGWSKEYRECSLDKLVHDILEYMKSFCMVKVDDNINIYPLVGKVIGDYPSNYAGGGHDGK
ncbi:TIGR02678 family protein [Crassaminicella indica]|uniref:TIGR02678 family protein n=1 Tax=Crassaminicella indica TaxID=2855394 RepID=A0ABX8RBY3_9CLOT|nr:TIGR02678 family protein [Crassaminicella indica]QXM06570.1 TIGR02678 family protein [Crassaminicella indica]